MEKKEAEQDFKEYYLPEILKTEYALGGAVDGPLRRETWNNYTDMLCKENKITDHQYANWSHPTWLESNNPLGSHWK